MLLSRLPGAIRPGLKQGCPKRAPCVDSINGASVLLSRSQLLDRFCCPSPAQRLNVLTHAERGGSSKPVGQSAIDAGDESEGDINIFDDEDLEGVAEFPDAELKGNLLGHDGLDDDDNLEAMLGQDELAGLLEEDDEEGPQEDGPAARQNSGEPSTSDVATDALSALEAKYPEVPVRAYFIADLFGKAAYYDAAHKLEEEFPEVPVYGLQSVASRVIQGDLYCCTPDYVEQIAELVAAALEAGASSLLLPKEAEEMDDVQAAIPATVPVLYVPHVEETAQRLAVAFYDAPSRDLLVVGVSGSHGKTTASWLIRGVLEEMEQVTGMLGTVEYAIAEDRMDVDGDLWVAEEHDPAEGRESSAPFHVTPYAGRYTTPGSTPPGLHVQKLLAGMRDRGAQCAVVEYAAPEVFQGSCDWVEVSVAVHTTLQFPEHQFGSHGVAFDREQLLEAALLPFSRLNDASRQAAVVNLDDPSADLVLKAASAVKAVTYGIDNQGADVQLETYTSNIWESEMIIRTPVGRMEIITPLLGKHNVYNILAAVATGIALKVPLRQIVAGIEAVEVIPGRSEIIDEGQDFSVIVDAADTPKALENMLTALEGAQNVITVFGCRGDEDRSMRPHMGSTAHAKSSIVIFTNDSPRTEPPESIMQDIVAGLPDKVVNRFTGYVYFPFQDQGHVPLWFEPYLQKAQRATKRYVMEDRFSAIRAAIGSAGPEDVVLIAGRGHRDCMEYGGEGDEIVKGWFDDRAEARSALSKLTYLNQLTNLNRSALPWGRALDEMETLIDPSLKYDRLDQASK